MSGAPAAHRLRLGVDFHTFDGIYQGSRSHLLGLYREAIVQAPEIDFLFFLNRPDELRALHAEFGREHVRVVRMPHRPGPWRLAWQLAALQRRHRLDFLHVQFRLPLVPAGACICTVHDLLFESHPEFFSRSFVRMARWSARHAVRRAALTATVSDWSRAEIARCYAVDPRQIVLTVNAVDRRRFHPGRQGEELLARWGLESGRYLCMLGRLEPRKNHANLVRAYARLGPDAPPLVIIGQRDFAYREVFELIGTLRLADRVRILEDVDDGALPALLRHARLMVYPSRAEGFGMPVLESLASGVPVITGTATSLPEVAGPAAWLVPPDDIDGLRDTLREALAEAPAARAARIELGLRHAEKFNWHDSAAALLNALRNATSPRTPGHGNPAPRRTPR